MRAMTIDRRTLIVNGLTMAATAPLLHAMPALAAEPSLTCQGASIPTAWSRRSVTPYRLAAVGLLVARLEVMPRGRRH